MNNNLQLRLFWIFAWLLIVVVSLLVRPLMPIDETRYAAVAWNMWLNHNFLVPYFLGHPYAQKPPLLFWLINVGWHVFGVTETWARLVPAFFALGSIFLTQRLASKLWPENATINQLAPTLLISNLFWLFCLPLLNFDMLVVFFVLLTLNALVTAATNPRSWFIVAIALGLGILSKGPVVLVYVIVPALCAPCWVKQQPNSWKPWYRNLSLTLIAGIVIALAWAIPAAISGGSEYAHAIFLKQSAGRLVDSFAHNQPIWWYLPLLPVLLLPWLIWPNSWRAITKINKQDRALRFIHLALWPALIFFNVISQKALRYLIPFLPLVSIFLAYGLSKLHASWTWQRWPVAIFIAIAGICAILIPVTAHFWPEGPPWLIELSPLWGFLLIFLAIIWLVSFTDKISTQTTILAAVCITLNLILLIGMARVAAPIAYDVRPLATELHEMRQNNLPIASVGKYYGQYQFYGKLHQPPTNIDPAERLAWAKAHPNGYIIDQSNSYYDKPYKLEPDKQYYYRDHRVLLWSSKRYIENAIAMKQDSQAK